MIATACHRRLFLFVLGIALLTGCDSSALEEDCEVFQTCEVDKRLELQLIESEARMPANISILFKVDTEDGVPIAGLTPADFEIYENERLVSRYEANQRILPKRGRFKYSIALMLDLSGSIVASENLPALKQAARSFVEAAMVPLDDPRSGEVEMSILWFDGRSDIDSLVSYHENPAVLDAGIERITREMTVDYSTNLYGAVVQGVDVAKERIASIQQEEVITAGSLVIFTDGTDQANRVTRSAALKAVRGAGEGISIYTIGLGGEIDERTLRDIGAGGFVSAANLEELIPKFRELAGLVRAEANSYYLLEYCSPKRAGDNALTVKARHEEYVGLLSTRFSARDFAPGCDVSASSMITSTAD